MKNKYLFLGVCVFMACLLLTGCIKSKQVEHERSQGNVSEDVVMDENGIIDLTPDNEGSSSDMIESEVSSDLESDIDGDSEQESIKSLSELSGESASSVETEAKESASIKDRLPKNVLTETDDSYIMNGVTVYFEPGLSVDTFVESGEAYVSEDGKTYLMHDVSAVNEITEEFIKDRFKANGVSENNIYTGTVGGYSYMLAEYDNEDAASVMVYVFVKDNLHLFTVAKESLSITELHGMMIDMLEHAQFTVSAVDDETVGEEESNNSDFSVYWIDKTREVTGTKEVTISDGATTLLGDDWECLDESQNLYYCGTRDYSLSMMFHSAEGDVRDEYEAKYAEVIPAAFGTPTEKNYITFSDESVIWTEYVYDNIEYQGKMMNVGVYVGKTDKGIFYAEFSTPADNRLQYNYIVTVLDNVKVVD